jgi:2-C-methyl-D-erythritol 4-phosphate cytidylyltransferase/2-C-methyl-D-erythritol 2,4-cyclodiphosphate synthase
MESASDMSADFSSSDKLDLVLLAAGSGKRFQTASNNLPKQFRPLNQKSLIAHCLDSVTSWPDCGQIILVLPPAMNKTDLPESVRRELDPYGEQVILATGGAARAESALNGLIALQEASPASRSVAIHDAARPVIPHKVLDALKSELDSGEQAVIPVLPVTDTIRKKGADSNDRPASIVIDRSQLMRVQTPQAFATDMIIRAHQKAAASGNHARYTDDAMVAEAHGVEIATIAGDEYLAKITFAQDLTAMRQQMTTLNTHTGPGETRTGSGFDVHKFTADTSGPIMICGVAVPHEHGLLAHSDGDVGLHALCDAIFGAMGTGDIGSFFPPSDPKWKDAASDQFLRFATEAVHNAGGKIVHLDVTLICERPKIGPHREKMRSRLAEITRLSPSRLSVKATTSEGLGFTGRGEGIAAMAQATICLPVTDE